MRIGVTSQNFRTITGHAGKTRRFLIFERGAGANAPIEVDRWDLPKEMSLHEYRGEAPHPTTSLDVLVTGGCGDGFIRRMAAVNTRLVVTGETDPATAVSAVLQDRPLPPPLPHEHG